MTIKKSFLTLLIVFSFVFFLFFAESYAASVNALSASYSDVFAAVSSANPGDTVNVPAGSEIWSRTLSITQAITLRGAGIDKTVITASGITSIISVTVAGDHAIDISGFTLDADNIADSKCLVIHNSSDTPLYNIRVHHNKFTQAGYMSVRAKGNVFGLIDNNQFVDNSYDLKIYGNDQNSWDDYPGAANIGTVNYLYIEDNTSNGVTSAILTSGEGARWVYRHNTINASNLSSGDLLWDAHGDTLNRGVVGHENYENTVNSGYQVPGHDYRGGTGIIFNNKINMTGGSYEGRIKVREEYGSCTNPGGCDGSSCGDQVNNGYIWGNVNEYAGTKIVVIESDKYGCLAENKNWWDDYNDSNFSSGAAESRLGTCSDDDCYWETDTKKLYRCDGANNWTFIYAPYSYPHPLSKSSAPLPPTNLKTIE